MESYHGMLACVTAGAGIALMPRSMLEAMPGSNNVEVYAQHNHATFYLEPNPVLTKKL